MAKRKRENGSGSITLKKNGRYAIAVTLGHDAAGKQIRRYATAATREEAQAKLRELQSLRSDNLSMDAHTTTLGVYLDQWLAYKKRTVRPKTYDGYEHMALSQLKPRLGSVKLNELTALKAEAMVSTMLAEGCSARMVRGTLGSLKNAMTQAVIWQLVRDNPTQYVKPPQLPRREMQVWTSSEASRFLAVAKDSPLYALFYLALATGARRGELLGLHWKEVDLDGGSIYIRYSLTKSAQGLALGEPKTRASVRRLALAPDAVNVLIDHKATQEVELGVLAPTVFVSPSGAYIWPRNMQRRFDKLIKQAGVPKIRFHDLRHTAASLLISRGVSAKVVAERLGHSNPSITLNTYTHLYAEQRQEAVISLVDVLDSTG